jgi:formiminoglutamase
MDDRNAINNPGCALGPDYVREKLYQLNEGSYTTRIVDLGNITRGETVVDTYLRLKNGGRGADQKDIIPVIIGGGQDLDLRPVHGL